MALAITISTFALLGCAAAFGQPAFDVASVKIAKGDRPSGGYNHWITPLGLTMLHVSMGYCIRLAYGVQRSYELVAPAWIDPPTDSEFDIVAKIANPVIADRIKLMRRTLLAERFKLTVHREKRNLPAYTLLVANGPPALRPSDGKNPTKIRPKGYDLQFENVSMSQLAQQLGPPMTSRPVVDMTGLSGSFDFSLDLGRY